MKSKEFLEFIVKKIVKYPNEIKIIESIDDRGIFLQLQVSKQDMGIIIGRRGEHAEAIKLIVKLFAFIQKEKIQIKIIEPKR